MISGGSLFLFDQKALKFFRRDGHNWRKKKNINTVRENHVKLKVIMESTLVFSLWLIKALCEREIHIK
jgi:hypothetical protein